MQIKIAIEFQSRNVHKDIVINFFFIFEKNLKSM